MLGEIQAAIESMKKQLQSLSEKQVDMDEKLNRMIDDMGEFSNESVRAWNEIYYLMTGERELRFIEVGSQSGDEGSSEEGMSQSGRASV